MSMELDQDQINDLKHYYSGLQAVEEGGQKFILIPQLVLPQGCSPQTVEGLLCPSLRDGYTSRLFLSAKVIHKGPGQNWNPADGVMIAGRKWWAVSWKPNNNSHFIGMIKAHLEAFK